MSINLHFETVAGGHHVDFPLQTPTKLTAKVIAARTLKEKAQLLRDWLRNECKWQENEISDVMVRIEKMLHDPTLRLTSW